MSRRSTRRSFLGAALGSTCLNLSDLPLFATLPRVSAAEARLDASVVRFGSDIEPLVRLIEDTPRERLLEQVAARIRGGVSYRDVLAALLLAGVRNVQPRPSVGFKFHAVLVVNSAHVASLASPEEDRWLPIFWALDYFKSAQAQDTREGNWTMAAVNESAVPSASKAEAAFVAAMDRWDVEAADAATAGLARSAGANQIFELFSRYGARDFRSIGHKAIFVANSWRTLQAIGWEHSEPVLRSLAYALLNHTNDPNPAESDLLPDRPWRHNVELAGKLRTDWLEGEPSDDASRELLATLRTGSFEDVTSQAVEMMNRGVAPQSVWDALFTGSGELLMRQPAIVSLHAVTSTNALHFAYRTTASDDTRRMLLLQNLSFLPLFRNEMQRRGRVGDVRIDQLEAVSPEGEGQAALEEIFSLASGDRLAATQKALGYLQAGGDPKAMIDAARRLVFLKGTDSHDYKFSSAVLEDFYWARPQHREAFLAASIFKLCGSGDRDNALVKRTRAALSG